MPPISCIKQQRSAKPVLFVSAADARTTHRDANAPSIFGRPNTPSAISLEFNFQYFGDERES